MWVGRQCDIARDEIGGGSRYQFRRCQRAEKAEAASCDGGAAGQRDHGHAHPQRVERCRGAVVGKRIQCNVCIADRGKVFVNTSYSSQCLDPARIHAMRFDAFSKNIFRRPAGYSDHSQLRAGYLLQDFAPRGKARVTDLGELIEGTENDGCSIIVTRCRKWHLIDGLVAPLTVRHSKELLAVKMLAL